MADAMVATRVAVGPSRPLYHGLLVRLPPVAVRGALPVVIAQGTAKGDGVGPVPNVIAAPPLPARDFVIARGQRDYRHCSSVAVPVIAVVWWLVVFAVYPVALKDAVGHVVVGEARVVMTGHRRARNVVFRVRVRLPFLIAAVEAREMVYVRLRGVRLGAPPLLFFRPLLPLICPFFPQVMVGSLYATRSSCSNDCGLKRSSKRATCTW